MTSRQIDDFETGPGNDDEVDERGEALILLHDLVDMAKEVAYQLAVMNERGELERRAFENSD